MPNFRCDFDVNGDLVLPNNVNELELGGSQNVVSTLKNGSLDEDHNATGLVITVIGNAESINSAEQQFRTVLVEQLDLLAFVTQSRFEIASVRIVMEWEAGQETRQFKTIHTVDARYPPEPGLIPEYLETADILNKSNPPGFVRTALKYFRYGLLDSLPEDQFMRLWLALEIIAENVKEKDRIPVTCSKCGVAVKCNECGAEPTRIPMAKQAIDQLISSAVGEKPSLVSKRQFATRNGLMHGRSTASIENECNMSLSDIVNELGGVTWHAIKSTIRNEITTPLCFGHRGGQFVNMWQTAEVLAEFSHSGESPHPTDDKIPSCQIEVLTRFGEPTERE